MLDAAEDPPGYFAVLTARELLTRGECRDHLQHLRRSLRKRWPAIRWVVMVEFQRRGALHLNLLVKGVPAGERAELHKRICTLWCSRVDALPIAQWVGAVHDGPGIVRYVASYALKPEQAPPTGWRGQRVSYGRDYLVRSASVLRVEARRSLRFKHALHRYGDEALAELELVVQDEQTWRLVDLKRARSKAELREAWPVAG
jgi:hypothetical protein